MHQTYRQSILSALHCALVVLAIACTLSSAAAHQSGKAGPDGTGQQVAGAETAVKAASASDAEVKRLGDEKASATTVYRAQKAQHEADQDALYAPYRASCMPTYPPERAAQCQQLYATYSTAFDASKAQFSSGVYAQYSAQWDALDAQQKREAATASAQREAAKRAMNVLLAVFPDCKPIGTTEAELEANVACFKRAFDGASGNAPPIVGGTGTPFFWNDKNPSVKKYHDAYAVKAKAQQVDEALLARLKAQPSGGDRDMRIAAVQQRMSDRANMMAFYKYQATTASK